MKKSNIISIGILLATSIGAYLYYKSIKSTSTPSTTSVLPPSLTSLLPTDTTVVQSTLPTTLSSTTEAPKILPLSALDSQIATLPSNTTIAQLQPLIAQQQAQNATVAAQIQAKADAIAAGFKMLASGANNSVGLEAQLQQMGFHLERSGPIFPNNKTYKAVKNS